MDKPSGEFFTTLGQYVYAYMTPDGTYQYIGKGNGDRCWSHTIDKGLDPENCFIVARNLDDFDEGKQDWQSFLLESYLIQKHQPTHNSVAGHYKENFEMASLSSMFQEFTANQHDNFECLPEWYVENYEVFRGKLREMKITSGNTFLLSNARAATYMMFYIDPTSQDSIKVTFEVNQSGDKLEHTKSQLTEWLDSEGYNEVLPDGKKQKFAVMVDGVDAVIKLFDAFMS